MKSFSYFYLLMLCSTACIHAMDSIHFSPSVTSCKIKRAGLTKQIRTIKNDINSLNKDNEQNLELYRQLLNLLKKKKATYLNTNCSQYKECVTEINHVEKIVTKHPEDLTVSTIATNNLELATLEAARMKSLAQEKEKQALKKFEKTIIDKISSLPTFFTKFDFENLILKFDNVNDKTHKESLEFLYKIKLLWFSAENKSLPLLQQIHDEVKNHFFEIYETWLTQETDPAWLNSFEFILEKCKQLYPVIAEVIKTVQKHPTQKICYQTLNTAKKEQLPLFKTYFELQQQLTQNPNKQTKITLEKTLREILNKLVNEHTEKAPNRPNYSIIALNEKCKQLKKEIENEGNCIIL